MIVFDELHLEPAEAERGRRAVADFLATGTAEGDRVALVGTGAGTRWTARMPEGREALLQALGRFQGKRAGDFVRDAMTEYEAMRIDQERDPIVTDQVTRRFLSTGAIRRRRADPEGRSRPIRRTSRPRGSRCRRSPPRCTRARRQRSEQSLGLIERSIEALADARGRKSLVLVSAGLVQDARLRRVPPGRDRLAARQHGRLLPRRPRPGGRPLRHAGRRRDAPGRRRPQHRRGAERDERGERGQRGARARHGRARPQEPQRPRGGARADRARGAQLLPRRLRAAEPRPRTGGSGRSR